MPRFEKGDTIVFEGDSLTSRRTPEYFDTWPYIHLVNWHYTWADHFMQLLFCWRPDLYLTFHNAASGEATSADVASRFEKFVLPHKPDWVLMTIGGNDAHQDISVEEFKQTLKHYCARVIDECGGKVGFLLGFRPEKHRPGEELIMMSARTRYLQALEELSDGERVFCIDYGTGFREKAGSLAEQSDAHEVYGDGAHTNAVGSMIMAGEVLKFFGILK